MLSPKTQQILVDTGFFIGVLCMSVATSLVIALVFWGIYNLFLAGLFAVSLTYGQSLGIVLLADLLFTRRTTFERTVSPVPASTSTPSTDLSTTNEGVSTL